MIVWIVLLGFGAVLTAAGTFAGVHPLLAAFCAPVVVALGMSLAADGPRTDAFWGLGVIIASICSLPVTIVTAIVTDNLMDKYALRRND